MSCAWRPSGTKHPQHLFVDKRCAQRQFDSVEVVAHGGKSSNMWAWVRRHGFIHQLMQTGSGCLAADLAQARCAASVLTYLDIVQRIDYELLETAVGH